MDLEQLKKEILILQDQAITNPESHFSDFMLEEFEDQISEEDHLHLIEDYDWYLYWIELCKEWLDLIPPLLEVYPNNEETFANLKADFLRFPQGCLFLTSLN